MFHDLDSAMHPPTLHTCRKCPWMQHKQTWRRVNVTQNRRKILTPTQNEMLVPEIEATSFKWTKTDTGQTANYATDRTPQQKKNNTKLFYHLHKNHVKHDEERVNGWETLKYSWELRTNPRLRWYKRLLPGYGRECSCCYNFTSANTWTECTHLTKGLSNDKRLVSSSDMTFWSYPTAI